MAGKTKMTAGERYQRLCALEALPYEGITLSDCRKEAHDEAIRLLDSSQHRALIVLPCGFGKSYIAWKIIDDATRKSAGKVRVLYITFGDQAKQDAEEKLFRHVENYGLYRNVTLDIYQHVWRYRTPEEPAALSDSCGRYTVLFDQYDLIILDEVHHALAAKTKLGIDLLFDRNPAAKVLALTATSYRSRERVDVADVMFPGQVAYRMHLHEAYVQRMLPLPEYHRCVVRVDECLAALDPAALEDWEAYQIVLEYYRSQAQVLKPHQIPPWVRVGLMEQDPGTVRKMTRAEMQACENAAFVYLLGETTRQYQEALCKVLKNHIGRYLVACSSIMQLKMVKGHIGKWLEPLGVPVHIYEYHRGRGGSSGLQEFVQDTSGALTLLLVVNLLLESSHDLSLTGLFLIRNTRSSKLYVQLVGRLNILFSKISPVIFDMVGAINHFSRSGSSSLMDLRELPSDGDIISYTAPDTSVSPALDVKVREEDQQDVYQAFKKMGRLRIPWYAAFSAIKNYVQESGVSINDIPSSLVLRATWTERGKRKEILRSESFQALEFLNRMRRCYHRESPKPEMDDEQKTLLSQLGIDYEKDTDWDEAYSFYCLALKNHIPGKPLYSPYILLGRWLERNLLRYYGFGNLPPLSEEQIRKMEAVGYDWMPERSSGLMWFVMCKILLNYTEEHLAPPPAGESFEKIYSFRRQQLKKMESGTLTADQKRKFEEVLRLERFSSPLVSSNALAIEAFLSEYGFLPRLSSESAQEKKLAQWIKYMQGCFLKGQMDKKDEAELRRIGIPLERRQRTHLTDEEILRYARDYLHAHPGDQSIPASAVADDGTQIGRKINRLQKAYSEGAKLSETLTRGLMELGLLRRV
ncbi:MAG: DEAD/DEAH box helicase family protein [Clostridia bacterium]|nr:DEAD/DEAH box helicase family protein [Clostridia bacterium]